MDVKTREPLTAAASTDDWETTVKVTVPAGTVVSDIEFEPPDPSVGIFQGAAVGTATVDGVEMLVAFNGSYWDWWGEPATEPGGAPVPGWFERCVTR